MGQPQAPQLQLNQLQANQNNLQEKQVPNSKDSNANPVAEKNSIQKKKKKKKQDSKGPSVIERLFPGNFSKQAEKDNNNEVQLDMEIKTGKANELYRLLKKAETEEEKKRLVIEKIVQHREQALKELKEKPTLISQGQKYFSDDCKEYQLLCPNQVIKKQLSEK